MKKTILLFVALITGLLMQAQTNEGFNFKGLLADNGSPMANQTITVRISIFQGNTLVWKEAHTNIQTDANGIFSVVMGEGTRISGQPSFDKVTWNHINMKYKVEVNTGSGYTTLVNNEKFKRVPFAKFAESIGQLKKLGVGEMPNQFETVRFKRSNPSNGNDVLDLEFSAAPASGTAQFIECNLSNSGTMFKVDHNGDIFTKGELHGNDSGDADMKAYIYGAFTSAGNVITDASSSGFTVSRTATGTYLVSFANPPGGTNKYIVVATADVSLYNVGINRGSSSFIIYTRNVNSNSFNDVGVSFVVFKK